jgi:phage terminase large subunit-like protein
LPLDDWQADGLGIMLSVRPDGKWSCFEYCELCSRQNGKTIGLFAPRALSGLFLLGERLIMWSAHEYKTAMESFIQLRNMISELGRMTGPNLIDVDGVPVKVNNTNGEEGFERLDTRQRVKFIARSKSSGRGFGGTNLIDESFAYTRVQQDALMPTILAQPNPQICYASSPPLDGDSGEVLFALRKRAETGGDERLGYRDWGLAGDLDRLDKVDLDARANWAATNPSLGAGRPTALTEEKILLSRKSMSDVGFAREVLGVWPVELGTGSTIDVARWAAMADPISRREGDLGLGVDITPTRDFASIALYGDRLDGLGHAQLIDYRAGTEWIVPRLVELRELKPVAVGMTAAAFRSLAPDLAKAGFAQPEKPEAPARGDLAVAGGADMAAACGQMIDASKQSSFRHVGQPQLDAAVAGAQTRLSGDSIVWSRKDASTDICPLVGLTVARWAFLTRIDALAAPVAPATARVLVDAPDPSELWRPTERLSI